MREVEDALAVSQGMIEGRLDNALADWEVDHSSRNHETINRYRDQLRVVKSARTAAKQLFKRRKGKSHGALE